MGEPWKDGEIPRLRKFQDCVERNTCARDTHHMRYKSQQDFLPLHIFVGASRTGISLLSRDPTLHS